LAQQNPERLFSCPNPNCKKSFDRPLKALDFQAKSGEVYEACPFCLSKISRTDKIVTNISNELASVPAENEGSCSHFLGYLHERTDNSEIPEQCLTCRDILSCMLRENKQS
jgi:hypothetical protein